jgi:xanthine dehydrogenase accessory factor
MAVNGRGEYCGFVSGGCTEAAVAAEALEAISKGMDRFLRLGEGSPFFDIVLPCGGGITLAIHVVRETSTIRTVVNGISERRRVSMVYDPGAQRLLAGAETALTGWQSGSFVAAYRPQPRLMICGRSIEVEATARVAQAVGYEIARHDVGAHKQVDPCLIDQDTAVVLLFHDIELEMPILDAALSAHPFYLGALGSSRTHARRCEALRAKGYSEAVIARIKAPIGLFGKARDSRSLALSVLADVAAAYGLD